MKPARLLYICLLSLALIAGCSSGDSDSHAAHQHKAPNGDLRETTASVSQLPSFLENVDPQAKEEIKEVYRLAGENFELLQWIPCYCGCVADGHKHNGNCFIYEVKEDGSVVWDDHGTRCGTCLEIAYISSMLKKEGKSIKEIRTIIDERYKEGYATPTPTPMPM